LFKELRLCTHVTDCRRIKRLLVVPVIAFCWAHRVGEWQHEQVKPIQSKNTNGLPKAFSGWCWIGLIRLCLSEPMALEIPLSCRFH
jgi:hypothetical protein